VAADSFTRNAEHALGAPEEGNAGASPFVVLNAKLRAPQARTEWVQRRALLDSLTSDESPALVLIDAPAGYGKTTLMAQWEAEQKRPFAWLSLDPADNDPIRFWTYLIEAVRSVEGDLGNGLLDHIRSPSSLKSVVVPRLLNELEVTSERLVLVLDDYHSIRNPACHELINVMLENLPPTTQLVISTRADPPLNLGRLRVEGKLFEIRASDLRFNIDEANSLLETVRGERLPVEQVEHLVERTEGWPTGIYLAAMSLRGRKDPGDFLLQFSGDNRLLADYLTMEVLQREPEDLRRFLIRTSILDRFTASLSSEVAGLSDSGNLLSELERSNLFVVPLDERREWYRYHHLFQQLLQSELRRSEPALVPELHRRACAWNRRHGLVGLAVNHAIAAGDIVAARELIWVNLLPYVNAGRMGTVHSWLMALGPEKTASDPILSLTAGWIWALSGHVDQVQEWLAAVERGSFEGPLPDGTPSLDSGKALLRAMFGHDGLSQGLDFARAAVEMESDPRSGWRAVAMFTLGTMLYLNGFYSEAEAPLREARRLSRPGQPVVEISSLSELSLLLTDMGDATRAKAAALSALTVVEEYSLGEIPQTAIAHTAMGRVLVDEGNLSEGVAQLEEALALRSAYPQLSPWQTLQTLVALAPARFAHGDQERALDLLRRARGILDFHPDAGILSEQINRLERSLGKVSQRPAIFGETLTDREISVLRLLESPLTHREIGTALFISLNTVKSHVRSIYQKLTISSRQEALMKAHELGLL
jgi:LuxR family transcriptional regulator, maltose regulon positive regulatory protein